MGILMQAFAHKTGNLWRGQGIGQHQGQGPLDGLCQPSLQGVYFLWRRGTQAMGQLFFQIHGKGWEGLLPLEAVGP